MGKTQRSTGEVKRVKMVNKREGWRGRREEVNVFSAFFSFLNELI